MMDLTTTDGLKTAALVWPSGRALHVEAFGRRMVAAEAVVDNGMILLQLKDDGAHPSPDEIIKQVHEQAHETDEVIRCLTVAIGEKDALIASLQPKPDAQPSEPVSDVAAADTADTPAV